MNAINIEFKNEVESQQATARFSRLVRVGEANLNGQDASRTIENDPIDRHTNYQESLLREMHYFDRF